MYDLEHVIQDKIEHMLRKISQLAENKKAVNFHFIFRAVTIDIITDFCYAQPYK